MEKTGPESLGSAVRVVHVFPRVMELYLFPDPPPPTTQVARICLLLFLEVGAFFPGPEELAARKELTRSQQDPSPHLTVQSLPIPTALTSPVVSFLARVASG